MTLRWHSWRLLRRNRERDDDNQAAQMLCFNVSLFLNQSLSPQLCLSVVPSSASVYTCTCVYACVRACVYICVCVCVCVCVMAEWESLSVLLYSTLMNSTLYFFSCISYCTWYYYSFSRVRIELYCTLLYSTPYIALIFHILCYFILYLSLLWLLC